MSLHNSVSEEDISPVAHVILGLVEVAAVVQASGPVDSLTIEVLLVVGWAILHLFESSRGG